MGNGSGVEWMHSCTPLRTVAYYWASSSLLQAVQYKITVSLHWSHSQIEIQTFKVLDALELAVHVCIHKAF